MSSHSNLKVNIRKRLKQLEISPYMASVAAGKRQGWLGQILHRGNSTLTLKTLDEISVALNVCPEALLNPVFYPALYDAPQHLSDYLSEKKK